MPNKKDVNEKGEYVRPESGFRHWVKADGSTGFKAERGVKKLNTLFKCTSSIQCYHDVHCCTLRYNAVLQ